MLPWFVQKEDRELRIPVVDSYRYLVVILSPITQAGKMKFFRKAQAELF